MSGFQIQSAIMQPASLPTLRLNYRSLMVVRRVEPQVLVIFSLQKRCFI